MGKSNYHIHSTYCDGKNTLEEMAQAAYDAGLTSIGFTSHFTALFEDGCGIKETEIQSYLDEIKRLRAVYKEKGMEILSGFEADFWMRDYQFSDLFRKTRPLIDYTIGSIHYMDSEDHGEYGVVDAFEDKYEESIRRFFGSPERYVEAYYEAVGEMALKERPEIVGHMDLIKKNEVMLNKNILNLDHKFQRDCAFGALDRIKQAGLILEVNTGAVARTGKTELLYPSVPILRRAKELGIPVTVNGDSHFTSGITTYFEESDALLRRIGYREVMYYKEGAFSPVPV